VHDRRHTTIQYPPVVAAQDIDEQSLIAESSIASQALSILESEVTLVHPLNSTRPHPAQSDVSRTATPLMQDYRLPAEGEAGLSNWSPSTVPSSARNFETGSQRYTLVRKFARRGGGGSRLKVNTAHHIPYGRARNTSSSSSTPFSSS